MINVDMTSTEGVTLATAGKYCAENIKVTASCIPDYRKFTGEIVSTVTGVGSMALLLTDPIIAEHYLDEDFTVTVTFDNFCTYEAYSQGYIGYTLIQCIAANSHVAFTKKYANPVQDCMQFAIRWGAASPNTKSFKSPLHTVDAVDSTHVGSLYADASGNLYLVVDSNNYAVRTSAYTVEISW